MHVSAAADQQALEEVANASVLSEPQYSDARQAQGSDSEDEEDPSPRMRQRR